MKRYLYIIIGALTLASCTKEPIEDNGTPGDGKTITATFTLSSEAVEEIEVRSVSGANERVIKDLWVIQLNETGTSEQPTAFVINLGNGATDVLYHTYSDINVRCVRDLTPPTP